MPAWKCVPAMVSATAASNSVLFNPIIECSIMYIIEWWMGGGGGYGHTGGLGSGSVTNWHTICVGARPN